jgi:hypothetical protein
MGLGKRHQETLCLDVDLPIHLLGDSGSGDAWPVAEMATAPGAQLCLQKWNELNSALSSAVTGKMVGEERGRTG